MMEQNIAKLLFGFLLSALVCDVTEASSDLPLYAEENNGTLCDYHGGLCVEPSRCAALYVHRYMPRHVNFFDCNSTHICCTVDHVHDKKSSEEDVSGDHESKENKHHNRLHSHKYRSNKDNSNNKKQYNSLFNKVLGGNHNLTEFCDLINGKCTYWKCGTRFNHGYIEFHCDTGDRCCYRPFKDAFISGYAIFNGGKKPRLIPKYVRAEIIKPKKRSVYYNMHTYNGYRSGRRAARPPRTVFYHYDYDHHHELDGSYPNHHGVTDLAALCELKQGVCVAPEMCATASRYAYNRFSCSSTQICCEDISHSLAAKVYQNVNKYAQSRRGLIPFEKIVNRTALCNLKQGTCTSPDICFSTNNLGHTLNALRDHLGIYLDSFYGQDQDFYCTLTTICCIKDAIEKFDIYSILAKRKKRKGKRHARRKVRFQLREVLSYPMF